MKFTIRDLLWLTVVVALGIGWWLEHRENVKMATTLAKWRQTLQDAADAFSTISDGATVQLMTPDGDYVRSESKPQTNTATGTPGKAGDLRANSTEASP